MRKSTRQLNKKLLDSLQNGYRKKPTYAYLYSIASFNEAKGHFARFMAMSLALLLLFSTVAGPLSDSIWGLANEPDELIEIKADELIQLDEANTDEAAQHTEELMIELPLENSTEGNAAGTSASSLEQGERSADLDVVQSPDNNITPNPVPDTNNENTDSAGTTTDETEEQPPVCICEVMCLIYLCEEEGEIDLVNYDCPVCAEDYTLCTVESVGFEAADSGIVGDGSPGDPFHVRDEAELRMVGRGTDNSEPGYKAWTLDVNYILMTDITLTPPVAPATSNWSSIGVTANRFTGVFDGNGKTITGLTQALGTNDFAGMFGYIGTGGIIRSLGLVNLNISGSGYYAGGIAGENSGTITNCFVIGSVSRTLASVAAIAGVNNADGRIENCYGVVNITGGWHVGGITGNNIGIITNSFSTGSVTSTSSTGDPNGAGTGGITGTNGTGASVNNCVALNMSITSVSQHIGRVVGINRGTLTNNRALNTMPVLRSGVQKAIENGATTVDGLGISAAETKARTAWDAAGFDFTTIWEWDSTGVNMPHLYSSNVPGQPWPEYLFITEGIAYVHATKGIFTNGSFDHPFRTIQAAYDALPAGGTVMHEIRVLSNLSVSAQTIFNANKTVTVSSFKDDSSGDNPESDNPWRITATASTFNNTANNALLNISTANSRVTLKNITINGAGPALRNRVIVVHTGGILNIEDGTTVMGGNVSGTSSGGSGILVNTGTLNMSSGIITGNTNANDGGGIALNTSASHLNMSGGIISNNTAGRGGGIHIWNGGPVNISGGTITGNTGSGVTATGTIGQLRINNGSKIDISDNKLANGLTSNILLFNTLLITLQGVPHEDSTIGITTPAAPRSDNPVNFATGAGIVNSQPESFWQNIFIPDRPNIGIIAVANNLQLAKTGINIIYVKAPNGSSGGNDTTGDGTFDKPYASLQRAYNTLITGEEGEIRLLSDINLPSVTTNFNMGIAITISSYCDISGEDRRTADDRWTIYSGARLTTNSGIYIDGISTAEANLSKVTFEDIILDGNVTWTGNNNPVLERPTIATGIGAANTARFINQQNHSRLTFGSGFVLQNAVNIRTGTDDGDAPVVLTQQSNAQLIIKSGAVIQNNHAHGTGIFALGSSSSMFIEGGLLHANSSGATNATSGRSHGAVVTSGGSGPLDIYLSGGVIRNNANISTIPLPVNATVSGAIAVTPPTSRLHISGNPQVYDNYARGVPSNVLVRSGNPAISTNLINISGQITNGANIGMTTFITPGASPVNFATGVEAVLPANPSDVFFADHSPRESVIRSDNFLQLSRAIAADDLILYVHKPDGTTRGAGLEGGSDITGNGSFAKPYASLAAAVSAIRAGEDGEIRILSEITVSAPANFTTANSVRISSFCPDIVDEEADKPHSIKRAAGFIGAMIGISNNETTLKNIIFDGQKDLFDTIPGTPVSPIIHMTAGTLNIEEGTGLINNRAGSLDNNNIGGGAIRAIAGAVPIEINMKGGEISGNIASFGGGVMLQRTGAAGTATFNMTGGKITGNTAYTDSTAYGGGGVYLWGSTSGGTLFNMTNGEISGNTVTGARGPGGGIVMYGSFNTVRMTGGSITGNKSGSADNVGGGGIFVNSNGTLELGGNAVIIGNTLNTNNTVNNVYLSNNRNITLNAPINNMSIGVITQTLPTPTLSRDLAMGAATINPSETFWQSVFIPDRPNDAVKFNGGDLQIVVTEPVIVYVHDNKAIIAGRMDGSFDAPYTNLRLAYAAIAAGTTGEIRVLSDITMPTNANMAFNLANNVLIQSYEGTTEATLTPKNPGWTHTRFGSLNNSIITVTNCTLTLKNIRFDGNANTLGHEFTVTTNGTLVLQEGAILDNNLRGGVHMGAAGTFILEGGEITGGATNEAVNGVGILRIRPGTPITIIDNKNSGNNSNNFRIANNIVINLDGVPHPDTRIGVFTSTAPTLAVPRVIARGAAALDKDEAFWQSIFIPDRPNEVIRLVGDEIHLTRAAGVVVYVHPTKAGAAGLTPNGSFAAPHINLQNAYNAILAGETGQIRLLSNLEVTGQTSFNRASSVTLVSYSDENNANTENPFTVRRTGTTVTNLLSVSTVGNNVTLEHVVLHAGRVNGTGGLGRVVHVANGTLTINDGTLITGGFLNTTSTGNSSGTAVFVTNGGSLIMNGGEVSGNEARSQRYAIAGIEIDVGTAAFIMNGGRIVNNTAFTTGIAGAGIAAYGGLFAAVPITINGGEISGNTAENTNALGGAFGGFNAHNVTFGDGVIKIDGNTSRLGSTAFINSNISLRPGSIITLADTPAAGSHIGVTTQTVPTLASPVNIATGANNFDTEASTSNDWQRMVFADNPLYDIARSSDNLQAVIRTTFYVKASGLPGGGSDTVGNGTFTAPFATIQHAYNRIPVNTTGEIRVLSDLNITTVTDFNRNNTVTISSYCDESEDEPLEASTAWYLYSGITSGTHVALRLGTAGSNVIFKNIIIDGRGGVDGLGGSANTSAPLIHVNHSTAVLTLGEGTVVQNRNNVYTGELHSAGGIVIDSGRLIIDGATLRSLQTTAGTAARAGAILIHEGTLDFISGTIENNRDISTSLLSAGGIVVTNRAEAINIGSGIVRISGNTSGGSTSNVFLALGQDIILIGTPAPGSRIGITTQDSPAIDAPITFTTGAGIAYPDGDNSWKRVFFTDNTDYYTFRIEGEDELIIILKTFFYVSTDKGGLTNGTFEDPYRTIQAAINAADASIEIPDDEPIEIRVMSNLSLTGGDINTGNRYITLVSYDPDNNTERRAPNVFSISRGSDTAHLLTSTMTLRNILIDGRNVTNSHVLNGGPFTLQEGALVTYTGSPTWGGINGGVILEGGTVTGIRSFSNGATGSGIDLTEPSTIRYGSPINITGNTRLDGSHANLSFRTNTSIIHIESAPHPDSRIGVRLNLTEEATRNVLNAANPTRVLTSGNAEHFGNEEFWRSIFISDRPNEGEIRLRDGEVVLDYNARGIYVCADRGSDTTGSGSFVYPVQTISRAYTLLINGGEIRVISNVSIGAPIQMNNGQKYTISSYDNVTGIKQLTGNDVWTISRATPFTNALILTSSNTELTLRNIKFNGNGNPGAHELSAGSTGSIILQDGAVVFNSRGGIQATAPGNLILEGGEIRNTNNAVQVLGIVAIKPDALLKIHDNNLILPAYPNVSNFYVENAGVLRLEGAPDPASRMGVYMRNPPVVGSPRRFATGADIAYPNNDEGWRDVFFSDLPAYEVIRSSDELLIAVRTVLYVKAPGLPGGGNDETGDGTLARPFATVQRAYNVAETGTPANTPVEIRVLSDLEVKDQLSFNANKTVEVVSYMDNGITLAPTPHRLWRSDSFTNVPNGLLFITAGNATLRNITLDVREWGPCVRVRNSGTRLYIEDNAAIKNGYVRSTTGSVDGAGLDVGPNTVVTMNGGEISGNLSESNRFSISGVMVNGTFIMNGGLITNNTALSWSTNASDTAYGGIHPAGVSSVFTMNGGTISNNTATNTGTGRAVGGFNIGANTTINGGTIINNKAVVASNNMVCSGGVHGGGNIIQMGNNRSLIISGNTRTIAGVEMVNNVNVANSSISFSGTPAAASQIGITTDTVPQNFASGTTAEAWFNAGVFFPDNPAFEVVRGTGADNNTLRLAVRTHFYVHLPDPDDGTSRGSGLEFGNNATGDGSFAKPFETLQRAYNVATAGTHTTEIRVLSDLTVTGRTEFNTAKAVAIQSYENETVVKSPGWTIRRGTNFAAPILAIGWSGDSSNHVTLKNIIISGEGIPAAVHTSSGSSSTESPGILVNSNTVLTMETGSVLQEVVNANVGTANVTGGIGVGSGATLNINGGIITRNSSRESGGVYARSGATVNMTAGEISHNYAINGGGGICTYADTAAGVTVNISGGKIINNSAGNLANSSGAIKTYSAHNNTTTISLSGNAEISGNGTQASGGIASGGFNSNGVLINIKDSVVIENNYTGIGNAIFNTSTGVSFTDGSKQNVFLENGRTIILGGALTSSSNIGVTTQTAATATLPQSFATGATVANPGGDDVFWQDIFFADRTGERIRINLVSTDQLQLFIPLTPSITLVPSRIDPTSAELTATVSHQTGPTPEGYVQFYQNGNPITRVLLTASGTTGTATATLTVTGLSGITSFTAAYEGQPNMYNGVSTTYTGYDPSKQDQTSFAVTPPGTKTYGDPDFTFQATGGSGTGAVTFSVPADNGVLDVAANGATTIIGAGQVYVTATKAGDDNYNYTSFILSVVVLPRDINNSEISVSITGSREYNGSRLTPVFTITDNGAYSSVTGSDYTRSFGENIYVTVGGLITITGQGNYTGIKTVSFSITPRPLTITPNTLSKNYGTSDPVLTFTFTGDVSGQTPAFTGTLARAGAGTPEGEAVGAYPVLRGSLNLANNGAFIATNYVLTMPLTPVNFTILAAVSTPTPTPQVQPTPTPSPATTPQPSGQDSPTDSPDDNNDDEYDDDDIEPDTDLSDSGIDNLPSGAVNKTTVFSIGAGSITISLDCIENQEDDRPIITVDCSANLIRAVLSPSELARIEAGESAEIRLSIRRIYDTHEVPEEDKVSIENAIDIFSETIEGLQLGKYHTITKEYRINNGAWMPIRQLTEEVTLTIEVPESLRQEGAEYYILRAHNGNVELLVDHDDNPNTITIKTDRFSTYALAFTSPGTLDSAGNEWSLLILIICVAGITLASILILFFVFRKRRDRIRSGRAG